MTKRELGRRFSYCSAVGLLAIFAWQLSQPPLTVGLPQETEPLTISTISLPVAFTGTSYWTSLTAAGGRPPYTYSIPFGILPPGLKLERVGAVSGVPVHSGTWRFTVQVLDSSIPPAPATANRFIQVSQPTLYVDLWSADFETGDLSQWFAPPNGLPSISVNSGGGEFHSGAGGSEASLDVAHSGRWSAKMSISTPPADSAARMFRWHEPQIYPSLYYSVWYYFPQRYSVENFWNIFQWKSRQTPSAVSPVDPFFILNVNNRPNGSMYLSLFAWQTRQTYTQSVQDIPVGKWFQVTAFYKCAGDNEGRVTLWQDGIQLLDVQNVQTRYPGGDCQWSVDSISDQIAPSPATFYIDDAFINLQTRWIPGMTQW